MENINIEKNNVGRIKALCISEKKGEVKHEIESADVETDWGIVNDAHAGKWHRQISILCQKDIEELAKATNRNFEHGAFAENIIIEGLDLRFIPIGSILKTQRGVVLELTQIGKECHNDCAIKKQTGRCVMPQRGLFFRVLNGGRIIRNDIIRLVSTYRCAVVVVSTSCHQGKRTDEAGEQIIKILREKQYNVETKEIVSDDKQAIKQKIVELSKKGVHLILTTGGTGLSPSDVTPEATVEVIDKRVDGICEIMRYEGGKKTSNAYLSRAVAGVLSRTLIVNLPGSTNGAVESLQAILGIIPHALRMLCADSSH